MVVRSSWPAIWNFEAPMQYSQFEKYGCLLGRTTDPWNHAFCYTWFTLAGALLQRKTGSFLKRSTVEAGFLFGHVCATRAHATA